MGDKHWTSGYGIKRIHVDHGDPKIKEICLFTDKPLTTEYLQDMEKAAYLYGAEHVSIHAMPKLKVDSIPDSPDIIMLDRIGWEENFHEGKYRYYRRIGFVTTKEYEEILCQHR